jgi:hypothetical protein
MLKNVFLSLVAEAASRVTQNAMMQAEQQRINEQMQDPLIQAKQAEIRN